MIYLYEYNEKYFSDNGLAVLNNALDVLVSQEINGDYRLSFTFPLTDEKIDLITVNRLITCEGQIFRINKVAKSNDGKQTAFIEALHIYFDNEKKHVQRLDNVMGTTPYEEISRVFSGTGFNVLSYSQVQALGMKWVDVKIDFFETSKTTPCEVVKTAIESAGLGELYIDNYNIALVEEIGSDNNITLNMSKNLKSISKDENIYDICTRLYPYGKSDLPIDTVNGGKQYIDSPNIDKYGIKEAHIQYSDIEDVNMLLARAKWNFDSENTQRMDIPSVTYEGKIIDLFKLDEYGDDYRLRLGDTVRIADKATGTDEKKRIIKLDYYPFQPSESSAIIGSVKKDLFYYLNKFNKLEGKVTKIETVESQVFYDTIVEVTREEVLAADVIEATSAFFNKAFVQTLQTNLVPFICKPNLTKNGDAYNWKDGTPTYNCQTSSSYANIWPLIHIEGINQKFIERHLASGDLSKLTTSQVEPLIIDGQQMYFTSLAGNFEYLTYVRPQEKYTDMTNANAEMFKVYIRKIDNEYVKADFNFKREVINSTTTYIVDFELGAGDDKGNGKMKISKLADGAYITYKSRTDGTEHGIKITDEGIYYFDIVAKDWLLIGTGGGNHVIIDYLPKQADIDECNIDDVVLVYDLSSPYKPSS